MQQEVDIETIWLFWLFSYNILKLKHLCVCVCILPPIGVEASETLRAVQSNPLHAAFL